MIHIDGSVRTDDLALATTLVIHGYQPRLTKQEANKRGAIWVFDEQDAEDPEFMEDIVHSYMDGACRVEPKRFALELRRVRNEMYQFLGIGAKAHGVRILDSPSSADAAHS